MAGRLSLATAWQTLRWLAGRARLADVRERWSRQMQFALLRPGQGRLIVWCGCRGPPTDNSTDRYDDLGDTPPTIKGKGFVFDCVTPHEGIRHARVAGTYAMTLDLANAIHRQIYMGCFANAIPAGQRPCSVPACSFLDSGARWLLLADCGRPRRT